MAQRRRTRDEWQALLREQKKSGLGIAAFARSRGLRPQTLSWWLWKLGPQNKKPHTKRRRARTEQVRMLPVSVVTAPRPLARVELTFGGLSVHFDSDLEPSYLAALVRNLESRGC